MRGDASPSAFTPPAARTEARLETPSTTLSPAGGSSALVYTASSARDALEAAARYASSQSAHRRVRAELAATNRRLRAIEERWIPAHEAELAALELSLDESEREDAARARWTRERLERAAATVAEPGSWRSTAELAPGA